MSRIMTRGHLNGLALALRSCKPIDHDVLPYDVWLQIVEAIAKECEGDNPRFDHYKFAQACGVLSNIE